MAHQLFTPQQAARSSIAALRYLTVLPRTVNMDFSSEFVAGRGRTVDVPKPIDIGDARVYTQANRTARDAIVFDELSQDSVPVTISDQVYKAVREPDDFATFDLTSLEQQVIKPMAESVVDRLTAPLLTEMKAVAAPTAGEGGAITIAEDGSDALQALIKLRKVLNSRNVPVSGRTLAVGPGVEAALLGLEQLQRVNESGSDGVLREATIGRLFGFDIIVDQGLGDDYGVAYNRDAFVFVTRPSAPPRGAAYTSTLSQDGFSLRWLQHYNPLQLEDQIVIDAFVGAETLDPRRAVSLTLA